MKMPRLDTPSAMRAYLYISRNTVKTEIDARYTRKLERIDRNASA